MTTADSEKRVAAGTLVAVTPAADGKDSYFGGKGSSFRHLINEIPPHEWLIVPFAGHCAVVRNIRLPDKVWLCDKDVEVFRWWGRHLEAATLKNGPRYSDRFQRINYGCGIKLLASLKSMSIDRAFVYLDPPYLLETRKSGPRYRCEMSNADHRRMLHAAMDLPCQVMISGYMSDMYALYLADWRHYSFSAATRRGMVTEHVWCNYPTPTALQDYSWLGANKRERFKLLRRQRNLIDKLNRLTAIERNALLSAVGSHFGDSGSEN